MDPRTRCNWAWCFLVAATTLTAQLAACSADESGSVGRRRGNDLPAQTGTAGTSGVKPGAAVDDGSFGNTDGSATKPRTSTSTSTSSDAGAPADREVCVQDNAEATLEKLPIDIIFTIDTSGSMGQEIAGVQSNINASFAGIIAASGIDYRVIMISANNVCIGAPLNPAGCGQNSPPTYYSVNQRIGSHDTWCVLLDSYPIWSAYLRPEAFKVFVAVTDDSPGCGGLGAQRLGADQAGAAAFDAALLALGPTQFGTAQQRNYVFHSLVALAQNTPATAAYESADPIVAAQCSTGAGNGEGYQHLSQLTGGLRFPVCEGNNFDAVFKRIAEGITKGAAVACEFDIPEKSDSGKTIDRDTIEVAYVPGDKASTIKFDRAKDLGACATEAFIVDGDRVKLCPAACDAVKLDPGAQVQVLFGCAVCGKELDQDNCPGTVQPPPGLPPIE